MAMNVIRPIHSPKNNGSYKTQQGRPRNPFELFCTEMRSVIMVQNRKEIADGNFDVDQTLSWKWRDLGVGGQKRYVDSFQAMNDAALKEDADAGGRVMGLDAAADTPEAEGEDTEMPDEAEAVGEEAEGGFTAVNRG